MSRPIDQRSSIWIGADNATDEITKSSAELYDIRVAPTAVLRKEYWTNKAVQAALMDCPVMLKEFMRAADHWAKVQHDYERSCLGFEVL